MEAILKLEKILYEVPAKLRGMTHEFAEKRPAPGKWSRKEIMGHLIDSAFNNIQRFVRMQLSKHQDLLQYEQNGWVAVQNYQDMDWNRIVDLWQDLNRHIVHIWKNMDPSALSNTGTFPDYGTQTLQFIIDDYVVHMEHHLKAVL
ncbi:MAG TPA: DinB family protein [Flavobacteriales bacterium]|nr:DinB family protein [Flavobacteriales bacterium]